MDCLVEADGVGFYDIVGFEGFSSSVLFEVIELEFKFIVEVLKVFKVEEIF